MNRISYKCVYEYEPSTLFTFIAFRSLCVCMLLIYAFLLIRGGSQIAGITIEYEKQERMNERTNVKMRTFNDI